MVVSEVLPYFDTIFTTFAKFVVIPLQISKGKFTVVPFNKISIYSLIAVYCNALFLFLNGSRFVFGKDAKPEDKIVIAMFSCYSITAPHFGAPFYINTPEFARLLNIQLEYEKKWENAGNVQKFRSIT